MAVLASGTLFEPTEEHRMLRATVAEFARTELDQQAAEHDARGVLNVPLLRRLGELGCLGLTVPEPKRRS